MAYEYVAGTSVIRLTRQRRRWAIQFNGRQRGLWPSPDAAVSAVAHHDSGLPDWDRTDLYAPDDVLDWRPLGDSL